MRNIKIPNDITGKITTCYITAQDFTKKYFFCSHQESNLNLGLRSPLFYPLNYEGVTWQNETGVANINHLLNNEV